MFRTKICGITTVADAVAAVEAGADCIGLNFYRASPRSVERTQAQSIRAAVRGQLLVAGVFVNAGAPLIEQIARELSLDIVQLSGNENVADLAEVSRRLPDTPIMQALRASNHELSVVRDQLTECARHGCLPRMILWDAHDPQQFGGTGRVADWAAAAAMAADRTLPRLVLAGGLRPENVAAAIRAVQPVGVDTASGVESSPGVKDAALMRSFVAAARDAFDNRDAPD